MKKTKSLLIGGVLAVLLIAVGVVYQKYKNISFEAPRKESMTIEFTVSKDMALAAITGDLFYYGFIKDETALKYALENTKDTKPGGNEAVKVGDNTIDREARYRLSQSMTAWQIADVLLNSGEYSPCNNGCPESSFSPELLPGGNLAPTIKEKYEWVKTFKDCVEAKGQLSSEQYTQRTGNPRSCVSPDGRQFIDGKEGWTEFRGG